MSSRKSFVSKAEAKFAEVQLQLSALAASAHNAVAAGRAEGERLLLAAQSKHDDALHRLELVKRAGEADWDAVKASFETAWAELCRQLSPGHDKPR